MKKNTYCLLIMLCACRSTDYYNITDRYEVISSTKEDATDCEDRKHFDIGI